MPITMKIVEIVSYSIERELGGNVEIEEDVLKNTVIVKWMKNPGSIHTLQFEKEYSYNEFKQLIDSNSIGSNFIEAYKNVGKPKVEETMVVKTKRSKVIKTEKLEENE